MRPVPRAGAGPPAGRPGGDGWTEGPAWPRPAAETLASGDGPVTQVATPTLTQRRRRQTTEHLDTDTHGEAVWGKSERSLPFH